MAEEAGQKGERDVQFAHMRVFWREDSFDDREAKRNEDDDGHKLFFFLSFFPSLFLSPR